MPVETKLWRALNNPETSFFSYFSSQRLYSGDGPGPGGSVDVDELEDELLLELVELDEDELLDEELEDDELLFELDEELLELDDEELLEELELLELEVVVGSGSVVVDVEVGPGSVDGDVVGLDDVVVVGVTDDVEPEEVGSSEVGKMFGIGKKLHPDKANATKLIPEKTTFLFITYIINL